MTEVDIVDNIQNEGDDSTSSGGHTPKEEEEGVVAPQESQPESKQSSSAPTSPINHIDIDLIASKLRDIPPLPIASPASTIHVSSPSKEHKKIRHTRDRSRTLGSLEIPELAKKTEMSETERAEQRAKLLWQEIRDSEKFYLEKLVYVVHRYKVPLEDMAEDEKERILTKEEINLLFGNIVEIKEFSKVLMTRLREAKELDPKIFIQMAPFMKVFTPYVVNFDNFAKFYAQLKSRKKWIKFEEECEKDPQSGKLSLPDILIMPVQRLPRFRLLLEELKNCTPVDHPQYQSLCKALDEVKGVASIVNQRKKVSEMMSEVLRIQNCLVGYSEPLVSPSRIFKKEGCLEVHAKRNPFTKEGKLKGPAWLFLFNDLLILTQQIAKQQYQFERAINLLACQNAISIVPDKPTSFCITYEGSEVWFTAPTTQEAEEWRGMIQKLMDSKTNDTLQNSAYSSSSILKISSGSQDGSPALERVSEGSSDSPPLSGKLSGIGSLKKKQKSRKTNLQDSSSPFNSPFSVASPESPTELSPATTPKQSFRKRASSLTSYFKKSKSSDSQTDVENQIKAFLYQN